MNQKLIILFIILVSVLSIFLYIIKYKNFKSSNKDNKLMALYQRDLETKSEKLAEKDTITSFYIVLAGLVGEYKDSNANYPDCNALTILLNEEFEGLSVITVGDLCQISAGSKSLNVINYYHNNEKVCREFSYKYTQDEAYINSYNYNKDGSSKGDILTNSPNQFSGFCY